MYVGRFVVVGRTGAGHWFLGYRVSSRSFPNRRIATKGDTAMVLPTRDAAPTDNPYVTYNCLRRHGNVAVVANGSHVDPTMDKVSIGFPLRDALALSLLALDYEHDAYNTPRIAGGVDVAAGRAYLAIVAEDRLVVERVRPAPGEALLVATYEVTTPTPVVLEAKTPQELAEALFDHPYEHPVASVAAVLMDGEMRTATLSARE